MYQENTPSMVIPGQKGPSTHFMESSDNIVYPTVVQMPDGTLQYLGDGAYNHAIQTGEYIKLPNEKQATIFGESYKKGTGVLKDFQKSEMQRGGQMNEEGQKQRNWLDSYIRSDKYLERLGKEMTGFMPGAYDANKVANERRARLMNLRNTPVRFLPESSDISPTPDDVQGVYDADEYPGMIMLRPEYSKGRQGPWSYNTIPLHEMGHAADEGGKRIPQSTKDLLMSTLKDNDLGIPKEEYYYTQPTEYINRLQPFRYLLQEEGIYDASKEDFTEKHLQKAKENTRIELNKHFQDLLRNTKSEKDLINLMNIIAMDERGQGLPTAQAGIEMDSRTLLTTGLTSLVNPFAPLVSNLIQKGKENIAQNMIPVSYRDTHYAKQLLDGSSVKQATNFSKQVSSATNNKADYRPTYIANKQANRFGLPAINKIVSAMFNLPKSEDQERKIKGLYENQSNIAPLQEREDLLNILLGLDQEYNSISIQDEYKPSKSKDADSVYYKSPSTENYIINQLQKDPQKFIKQIRGYKDGVNYWAEDEQEINTLGNYTLSIGVDDKGEYISYYDIWDLQPFESKAGTAVVDAAQSLAGLNAPEIYGRVYLKDDANRGFKKEFESVPIDKKKKEGGSVSWNWKGLPTAQFGIEMDSEVPSNIIEQTPDANYFQKLFRPKYYKDLIKSEMKDLDSYEYKKLLKKEYQLEGGTKAERDEINKIIQGRKDRLQGAKFIEDVDLLKSRSAKGAYDKSKNAVIYDKAYKNDSNPIDDHEIGHLYDSVKRPGPAFTSKLYDIYKDKNILNPDVIANINNYQPSMTRDQHFEEFLEKEEKRKFDFEKSLPEFSAVRGGVGDPQRGKIIGYRDKATNQFISNQDLGNYVSENYKDIFADPSNYREVISKYKKYTNFGDLSGAEISQLSEYLKKEMPAYRRYSDKGNEFYNQYMDESTELLNNPGDARTVEQVKSDLLNNLKIESFNPDIFSKEDNLDDREKNIHNFYVPTEVKARLRAIRKEAEKQGYRKGTDFKGYLDKVKNNSPNVRMQYDQLKQKLKLSDEEIDEFMLLFAKNNQTNNNLSIAQQGGEYIVKSGDTFDGIANKVGVKRKDLELANPGARNKLLQLNQKLLVPSTSIKSKDVYSTVSKVPSDFLPEPELNIEALKKGIAQAESLSGKLMVNPQSTATGLYGQRFSELEDTDLYKGTRKDFAKDLEAQNRVFEIRLSEGVDGKRGLIEDAEDLYAEYSPQIEGFDFSKEELIALANFLGRQGTRNYLGYHLRDGKPLSKALPNIYGSNAAQANKTPEQYLKTIREYLQKDFRAYSKGGELNDLNIYSDYINGNYDDIKFEKEAQKVYDKLNRIHYKNAKQFGMSAPNYIMTYLLKNPNG